MYQGRTVFSQVLDFLPRKSFRTCVKRYNGNYRTVADLYKSRWQVELFFKWIKQHLRIKKFFGVSETAVKTQIWIAISVYVLVAIIKKRLALDHSLYTILQVLSITLFEKTIISRALAENDYNNKFTSGHIQLNLFDS